MNAIDFKRLDYETSGIVIFNFIKNANVFEKIRNNFKIDCIQIFFQNLFQGDIILNYLETRYDFKKEYAVSIINLFSSILMIAFLKVKQIFP